MGIAGAFEQVIAEGIPIGTVLFPVGPDLNSLDPQVPGITTTVAFPPVAGATVQAETVVAYCADKDPGNVDIMIGGKIFPFDNLRLEPSSRSLAPLPTSRFWPWARATIRPTPP